MNKKDKHSPAQAGAVAVYGANGHTSRFIHLFTTSPVQIIG